MSKLWLLMDPRATTDIDRAIVLTTGTCQEMCDEANDGSYGEHCRVVGPDGQIAWNLLAFGRWNSSNAMRST
jgi:hypothetical protein